MSLIRLGQVDFINYLPVYHALEEGVLPLEVKLVKGTPTRLNRMFLNGDLEAAPISTIEYARNFNRCFILPDLSISADGRVSSVLLFSKIPVTELEGKKVCLTESSSTSVALLKVLFDHYYHVDVHYETTDPDLGHMMERADGALLTGDDAMRARQRIIDSGLPYQITDLGEAWKKFFGERMVYTVWAVMKTQVENNPKKIALINETLLKSREIGLNEIHDIASKACKKTGLPINVIEDYFSIIKHDFDEKYRKALLTFYDYAYKSGLIEERVKLHVWNKTSD
ncbi:MAG: putative periplasmic solute-binding protein [Pelotomaculum thermopropionicum]|uniref:Chorismate dehydratase n=1 Tax=Pelotomaculum thermopropionicum TaxID=110500 RepID=A0A101HWJ4_9FIRM|nr:MAG: putative periplasmic solute-binding protein [Pelotomaculum thermopropionicum]